ncbi:TAF5-like RNA polymerase II p300/CBP-associated factor-associated factor 65 kDa subunit 5L [Euwallacea similis]|uniref:TAF5-like RNA polymerase II p300/CBP-associated factor-associated factor 65 kDa subunit 5L n=1 Tax=Euwallacea similis TaxID=1736056 RepID=UPI00344F9802
MDDGKRENNRTKRPKSDNIKSVLSVYLQRRQFANVKPRTISKKTALKRALSESSIRRPNSVMDNFISESDLLQMEYSYMFQKFVLWLKEQVEVKRQCHDVEKLVGPLFCHFYIDLLSTGKSQEAVASSTSFFKAHVEKVNKSQCDDSVRHILNAVDVDTMHDEIVLNGSEDPDFDNLKDQFRSMKVVTYIKPESLGLLKKFVVDTFNIDSHILLLQSLQTWFDFRIVSENDFYISLENHKKYNRFLQQLPKDNLSSFNSKLHLQEKALQHWIGSKWFNIKSDNDGNQSSKKFCSDSKDNSQAKFQVTSQRSKLRNLIKKTSKLPASVCNVKIVNTKNVITCGFMKSSTGLAAFAEGNILRLMPLQVLVDCVCNIEQVNHIRFIHHSKQIYCITLSSDNDVICTGSADCSICIYSLKKVEFVKRLYGHLSPIYCLSISGNSKYLASGSHDGTARLWNLKSGEVLRVFAGHTDAVTSIDFHPNSLYVATGSADRNVRIWCINSADTVRLLHAAKREVYAIAFSPNGQYVASASDDKKVRLWDVSTSKVYHEFKNRESSVLHLLWSNSGKQLCGGTASGVVKIWEVKDKDKEQSKEHKHSDPVLRRHVDGRLLSLDASLGYWTCLSVPKS